MGQIYIMSDIHNDVNSFNQMLDLISFQPEKDYLIILGDIFDKGPEPYELYKQIRQYGNSIKVIRGNHEEWLKCHIDRYCRDKILPEDYVSSINQMVHVSDEELESIGKWISEMELYLCISVEGNNYMLAHAQTTENPEDCEEALLLSADNNLSAFYRCGLDNDYISIVGHIPVQRIRFMLGEESDDYTIWKNEKRNVIAIDSGNAYRTSGGRLSCLRLNDMREYYV